MRFLLAWMRAATVVAILLGSGLAEAGESAPPDCAELAVLTGKDAILRGSTGMTRYSSSTHGNTTVIRDAIGRTVATATDFGGSVTFRSSTGATLGTMSSLHSNTTLRDAMGRTTCTLSTHGDHSTVRSGSGTSTGSVSRFGNHITLRDAIGRTSGTVSIRK